MSPVRIVDSPGNSSRSSGDTTPAARSRRPSWRWFVGAGVVAVALVVALVVAQQPSPPGAAPTAAPSTAAPSGPAPSSDPGDAVRPQYSNVIGPVDGVPGLWRGTATVTSGYSGDVEGVPRGWPKTIDGAAAAALTIGASAYTLASVHPSTAPKLDERLLSKSIYDEYRSTQASWERAKAWYHLNEAGEPLNMDDEPSPELRLHWTGYARYGAYQVTEVADDLSTVHVLTMVPIVDGVAVGDDLSGVRLRWFRFAGVMVWEEGDWRVQRMVQEVAPEIPTRQTNQPFAVIRAALGPGWSVPADATDKPYPGVVLAR